MRVFVLTPDKSYASSIGRRLKLVEVNLWDKGRKDPPSTDGDREGLQVTETVFETVVEQGRLSSHSIKVRLDFCDENQKWPMPLGSCTVAALHISSIREHHDFINPMTRR
jgi:hypothetical protein